MEKKVLIVARIEWLSVNVYFFFNDKSFYSNNDKTLMRVLRVKFGKNDQELFMIYVLCYIS